MADPHQLRDAVLSFLARRDDWSTIDTIRTQVKRSVPDIEPDELEDTLQVLVWEGKIDTATEDGVVSYRIETDEEPGDEQE